MDTQQLRDAICSAQAGDAAGYEAILRTYNPRLYGYFLRATGQTHDAEDLLGELTLRLVRTLGRYDHRGRFEPWLFRIAANLLRDRFRKSKTRPKPVSLSGKPDERGDISARLPGPGLAVDAGLLRREANEQLHEALAHLDDMTREMILLRHFGQLSFREIATQFGCPLGTALARVHRGLKKLRANMEE